MIFFDHTLLSGSDHSRRQHNSDSLLPAAIEVFRSMLATDGSNGCCGDFRKRIPAGPPGFDLQFTSESPGCALATFWCRDVPVTTSALLAGRDADGERACITHLQAMVVRLFHDTSAEPGFDLAGIAERPVIVSLVLPCAVAAGLQAIKMIADAETCFAAAYFLTLEQR